MIHKPLFRGAVASAAVQYIPVPVIDGCIGAHIGWPDATTAGAFALQVSSYDAEEAPVDMADDAEKWPDSGEVIAPIAASAAGARLLNIMNVQQLRARLKYTASANSFLTVKNGVGGRSR